MSKKRQDAIFAGGRVGAAADVAVTPEMENLGPVIKVNPLDVKMNPKNSDFQSDKHIGWEKFVADVKENGIHDPIILKRDYTLLAGERRTLAALNVGLEAVPARIYYGDLSGEKERRFIIRDNLHRRQLTTERRGELIQILYAKELKEDNRGKRREVNLAKTVAEEMNLPIGTAKRVVAKARKVSTGKPVEKKPAPKVPDDAKTISLIIGTALKFAKSAKPAAIKADKELIPKVEKLLTALRNKSI